MNDCRLLDGMAATRWSLKYSSESVFDGQSERTKSRAGRWDALFRIRLFHPHEAHPPPPRSPAGSQPVRWIAKRKKGKGQKRGRRRGERVYCVFQWQSPWPTDIWSNQSIGFYGSSKHSRDEGETLREREGLEWKKEGKEKSVGGTVLSGVPNGIWLEEWKDRENEREAVRTRSERGTREYPVAPGSFESDAQ